MNSWKLYNVLCAEHAPGRLFILFPASASHFIGWWLDYMLDCTKDKVHDSCIHLDVTGSDHSPPGEYAIAGILRVFHNVTTGIYADMDGFQWTISFQEPKLYHVWVCLLNMTRFIQSCKPNDNGLGAM